MEVPEAPPPSARSDLVSGGVWAALGIAIMAGAWTMDRLEKQGVPPFAAPGLVPGILGVLITLSALAIVLRSLRRGALSGGGAGDSDSTFDWRRAALAIVLCLGFAAGLVGRVPFWIAAPVYLFLHITLLQWPERRASGQVVRGIAVAAAVAIGAGVGIAMLFQYAFLVRLP
jgi:Tripartite tricarboxylate transporter TctB family